MPKSAQYISALKMEPYSPCAVYFEDSDCVEYVKEDTFTVYERIDDFLTLIFDDTKINLIGFKLKGFTWAFEKYLKSVYELNNRQFIEMVSVIEAHCTKLGDELFADEPKSRAYKAAYKLATDDHVRLSSDFIAESHMAATAMAQEVVAPV